MDECVAVAVAEAVAVAVTEAVAEADQSIHDPSTIHQSRQFERIEYLKGGVCDPEMVEKTGFGNGKLKNESFRRQLWLKIGQDNIVRSCAEPGMGLDREISFVCGDWVPKPKLRTF